MNGTNYGCTTEQPRDNEGAVTKSAVSREGLRAGSASSGEAILVAPPS